MVCFPCLFICGRAGGHTVASVPWPLRMRPLWRGVCRYLFAFSPLATGGIAGSGGSSSFHLLRHLRTVFRSGCTKSRSRQQRAGRPPPPSLPALPASCV